MKIYPNNQLLNIVLKKRNLKMSYMSIMPDVSKLLCCIKATMGTYVIKSEKVSIYKT